VALGGLMCKRWGTLLLAGAAVALTATPGFAADLSLKDTPAAAPTPDWDIAFGSYAATDYIFRGISQSAREPSVSSYSELRYNLKPDLQLYFGSSGESIDFPNRAAAEVDFYAGVRPTFGKLALDFGGWYYWYPGGREYNGLSGPTSCTNGANKLVGQVCNVYEADLSFWEAYGKAAYTVNDSLTVGANVFYSPSWLNEGADGTYASGTAKLTLPTANYLPKDIGAFLSGEFGHYWFGQTNSFYGNVNLPEYNTWNAGISFTYKVWTLDFRYYDTDLSKGDCNTLTSDHTETNGQSNWCGSAFVFKASVDLTANTNLK